MESINRGCLSELQSFRSARQLRSGTLQGGQEVCCSVLARLSLLWVVVFTNGVYPHSGLWFGW